MSQPQHILYISDNKAGHRSQALGLYHAMQRVYGTTLHFTEQQQTEFSLFDLICCILTGKKPKNITTPPCYLIGVGSHTHLTVALLGKIYPQAKTLILMKTSLPFSWFDYHIIPQHDRNNLTVQQQKLPNVFFTQGVLNPIVNQQQHQAGRILIALGGSSKRHQWENNSILTQLLSIIQQQPQAEVIVTTSRRTPSDFLTEFNALFPTEFYPQIQFFPVEQTPQGWIFEQMQLAETVWVSEDSVSMIFEALTSGAKVGILSVKRLKHDRIIQMLNQLLEQPQPLNFSLNEAEKVAEWLKHKEERA